ncbi:outer membrane beta-barrel protein [Xanthomonas sp. NCPPB 2632]|uniref:outer membrane beta-barrel protein n=1 Tax=Xanthomonas sp. NCPPB 2632 TaxID=3240912 RepID=UPI003515D439
MQKALLKAATAASFLFASTAAVAVAPSPSTSSGPFLELGAGKAVYGLSARAYDGKSAMSYSLTGGYRWPISDNTAAGVEFGYVDLGTVRHRKRGTFVYAPGKPQAYTHRSSLEGHAWTLGGTIRWQWTPEWSLTGRAGLARTDTVYRSQILASQGSSRYWSHTSRGSLYLGVGVGYAISPHINVSVNVTHYALTGLGLAPRTSDIGVNTYGTAASLSL